jgi:carbonic anhydrase
LIQPGQRGRGIGKRLFDTAMGQAQSLGYRSVVLDSLPHMRAAQALYIAYGFQEIHAYYDNPEPGTKYYRYIFD